MEAYWITGVKGSQISVTYSVRGAKAKVPPMHTVQRSLRDVSILYSAGDLMVNTREHFSAMKESKMDIGNLIILYLNKYLL